MRSVKRLLLLTSCLFLASQYCLAKNTETLIIGVQDFEDYLPYSRYENLNYQGFNRDLLDAFAQDSGLTIELRPMPIQRLYQALNNGDIDARYPDNPDWVLGSKPQDIHYSNPVVSYIDGALVRPENAKKGIMQLTHMGIIRGYSRLHAYAMQEKRGSLKVSEQSNVSALLESVIKGDVQAGYVNLSVANHYLRHHATESLIFNPSLPYKRSFRHLSSRTRPELIKKFNGFLKRNQHTLAALKKHHHLASLPDQPYPPKLHLTSHDLAPYGSFPSNKVIWSDDEFTGIAVDIVRCALDSLNVELNITVVPWLRAQTLVINAAADGFFAASQSDERDKFAVLSEYIADQKWQWIYLSDGLIKPKDAEFKSQARIGAFIGSNMLSWLEKNNYPVTARSQNTQQLLRMLRAGRIDSFLANDKVMDTLLSNSAPINLERLTEVDKPLGVYFRKNLVANYPKFLPAFNQAVKQCRLLSSQH